MDDAKEIEVNKELIDFLGKLSIRNPGDVATVQDIKNVIKCLMKHSYDNFERREWKIEV